SASATWQARAQISAVVRRADACPAWRILARMPEGSSPCPEPSAPWTVRPLFSGHAPPSPLAAFCVYEHPEAGGELELDGEGILLQRDCMGLTPHSDDSTSDVETLEAAGDATLRRLEERFLE
ncbi:MAG: hypothetical protein MI919_38085, partial [Holophagales bacterium]|nr:hypothetical protein [Holophagales bacterium]